MMSPVETIYFFSLVLASSLSVYFGRYFWFFRVYDRKDGYLIKSWIPFFQKFVSDSEVTGAEKFGFWGWSKSYS